MSDVPELKGDVVASGDAEKRNNADAHGSQNLPPDG